MAGIEQYRIVLASGSPRRKELLGNLGLQFDIIPSDIPEEFDPLLHPSDVVHGLAVAKAKEVAQRLTPELDSQPTLVLGSDTIVVLDEAVINKPGSFEEACEMLGRLSGRCHEVYTGVALLRFPEDELLVRHEVSKVYIRPLKKAEIEAYVETGEPMDKAGAYALQGIGAALVEKVEGCVTNIIGLPIPLVVRMLRDIGIPILGTT